MNNEGGNLGKLFIIILILLVIIGICGIGYIVINDKEHVYTSEKPKESKKKKEKVEAKYNKIEQVISDLDYSKVNDNISNDIILIDDFNTDYSLLINAKTGEKIIDKVNYYDWYGNFGVVECEEYDYIVDKKGKILFYTEDEINYNPVANLWDVLSYDAEKIYKNDGELFDELDTHTIDDEGLYYYNYSDKLKIYDYNKKLIYEKELDKDIEDVLVETYTSSFDEVYAAINLVDEDDNYKSAIINLKEGNIVYDYVDDEINCEDDNLFTIGDKYLFIHNDKVTFEFDEEVEDYSLSDKYVTINDDIYDLRTMNKINKLVYIPDYEENLIERETGLEITACLKGVNIKYGLKYKGKELLSCEHEDISYYSYDFNKLLLKSNKLYVQISDNFETYIYDVNNEKKLKDVTIFGIISDIYENEDSYFYNVLNGKSVNNKNGEELYDSYDNYYVLTDEDESYYSYYDSNFKKFYEIK